MKALIAVLPLLALVHSKDYWEPRTDDEMEQIRADCQAEHTLSEETLKKIKNIEYPDEEPVHKFVLCVALHADIFCTEGGFHADRVAKQFKMDFNESEVLAIAESCMDRNPQGSPVQEWAYREYKCFLASKVGDQLKTYAKEKYVSDDSAPHLPACSGVDRTLPAFSGPQPLLKLHFIHLCFCLFVSDSFKNLYQ